MRANPRFFYLASILVAYTCLTAGFESDADSILDHCEFEQPEILDHYFPTFLKDPETSGYSLPLIDMLIGDDGIPIQQVQIGELPPGMDGEVVSLIGRYMRFTPAMACSERVEGFFRFSLNGYFYVEEQLEEELTTPPYARFTLPEKLFSNLRMANFVEGENQLKFILSLSKEGKIEGIKGTSNWSRHLAKNYLNNFFGPLSFTPALCGEDPVSVKLAMVFSLSKPDLDRAVLNTVHFTQTRKPMPIRPEEIEYTEPKVFNVGGLFTSQGLISQIQIFDPIEKPERISVINAMRNWYLPKENPDNLKPPVVLLKFSFTADSHEALLLEETYPERLSEPPTPIKQGAPWYPVSARKMGLQGVTEVVFVVGKNGNVLDAVVTNSTDPVFVDSALNAVRRWKFKPGSVNGTPVNTRCRIFIPFKFNR